MTSSTVGEISTASQDEGFASSPDCDYQDNSVRRVTTQEYLDAVNWSDPGHVSRALRVFERLLEGFADQYLEPLRRALRRDGYILDEDGQITQLGPRLPEGSLSSVREPAAIRENLGRIQRAITDDPAQVFGSAKELIESTAKVVLLERGRTVDDKAYLPTLVREAQQALNLHPSTTPGPDGSDAVKKILGSVSGVAIGVAELRNRGYGIGHGVTGARVGLRDRHAHLAVNAAVTWCQLMLDTLADSDAPWRSSQVESPRTNQSK